MKYNSKTLKNGINLYELPIKGVRSVTLALGIKGAGLIKDPSSKIGLHNLLVGSIMRGSEKYPTYEKLNFEIENLGGSVDVTSSDEAFYFYISIPSRELEQGLDILLDLYQNALLSKKDFEKAKNNVKTEIRGIKTDPFSYASNQFAENLLKGSKLAHNSIGNLKTVDLINIEDIQKAYKALLKQPISVFAGGDLNDSFVERSLEPRLNEMKYNLKEWEFNEFKASKTRKKVNVIERELEQAHIFLGSTSYGIDSDQYYALLVGTAILGSGFGSLAFRKIREEMKLAYAVKGSALVNSDVSILRLYAGINKDLLYSVIEESIKIFNDLAEGNFSKKDLHRSQQFLLGVNALSDEGVAKKVSKQISYTLFRKERYSFANFKKSILDVTSEDVQKVFSDAAKDGRFLTVIGADNADKDKLEKLIG